MKLCHIPIQSHLSQSMDNASLYFLISSGVDYTLYSISDLIGLLNNSMDLHSNI